MLYVKMLAKAPVRQSTKDHPSGSVLISVRIMGRARAATTVWRDVLFPKHSTSRTAVPRRGLSAEQSGAAAAEAVGIKRSRAIKGPWINRSAGDAPVRAAN